MALPEVVSPEEWLEARVRLLAREKEQTRAQEALNAERRAWHGVPGSEGPQFGLSAAGSAPTAWRTRTANPG